MPLSLTFGVLHASVISLLGFFGTYKIAMTRMRMMRRKKMGTATEKERAMRTMEERKMTTATIVIWSIEGLGGRGAGPEGVEVVQCDYNGQRFRQYGLKCQQFLGNTALSLRWPAA